MTTKSHIGKKILQIRELKNITLDELAERSQLSAEQVSQIEEEKILPSWLHSLKLHGL